MVYGIICIVSQHIICHSAYVTMLYYMILYYATLSYLVLNHFMLSYISWIAMLYHVRCYHIVLCLCYALHGYTIPLICIF